ncbi:MAG TPA: PIN domain-containing protein [Leptospiraceae bacterium]|nr:PIN domain-containing protein [Leptospiraceae bacterium]HMW06624.1 PIN domain-containing protein [Leptospiraceae bacterium]HMX32052.1 PIN domain-containing protein [Leptospiraceae bacterium]HMY31185.1 PIN domain-containing protein [Leptospiraceae bacterium]HMZ65394.1 PIN domain-containing protein [Leptospiraceae bacterium]
MRKIHLDTNFLIELHVIGSKSRSILKSLLKEKVELSISAITWHEFLCGPLDSEYQENILNLVEKRIVAVSADVAELGAILFNASGRKKGSKADCLIAATSIYSHAELLTWNLSDFKNFQQFGLLLV